VVKAPVVLVAMISSVLVDPLPDWAPVCDGLERREHGGVDIIGWFTGLRSAAAGLELDAWTWTIGCAKLDEMEGPFPAKNMIA
jgi:hypothetical protein